MATDIKKIINNLLSFYDFSNKIIISVGAGGGQFIEYGRNAEKVFAIDNKQEALNQLKENLQKKNLDSKFKLIHSDFESVFLNGDVVLFEFCLHEMKNSFQTIQYAKNLAGKIIIADHWIDSEWAYYIDEEIKVQHSWQAIESQKFKKIEIHRALQFFNDYEEIYQKVKIQGENAIKRIEKFKNQKNFEIPMSYAFAMI